MYFHTTRQKKKKRAGRYTKLTGHGKHNSKLPIVHKNIPKESVVKSS